MFALIISVAVSLSSFTNRPLEAHGDMRQIYEGMAGNHFLKVSVMPHKPMVGHVHFSVEPSSSSTGLPIEQALMTITARKDGEAFESRAVNSTISPTIYDANLTFYEEGSWIISVEISTTPDQEYEVEFPMEVSGDSIVNNGAAGYFFVFVFLVLIMGVLLLSLKYRKKDTKNN
jgi:hypothetical protein